MSTFANVSFSLPASPASPPHPPSTQRKPGVPLVATFRFPALEGSRLIRSTLVPAYGAFQGRLVPLLNRGGGGGQRDFEAMAAAAAAAAAATGAPGNDDGFVLITFDVDGTLLRTKGEKANAMHKKAFTFAFQEVYGIDGTIDAIQHHGGTDQGILVDTSVHYGISKETAVAKLPDLMSKMLEYAKNNSFQVGDGLELLPGVAPLLEILTKHEDVVVALVTGNLEDIGWLKMDALGIRPFFTTPNFGGFGSDHVDRGELVKIAAARAKALLPGEVSRRIHVGDTKIVSDINIFVIHNSQFRERVTFNSRSLFVARLCSPNDIRAAEYGGALAIGVCTGVFEKFDLQAASESGNAVILDDLQNAEKFLKACGLQP